MAPVAFALLLAPPPEAKAVPAAQARPSGASGAQPTSGARPTGGGPLPEVRGVRITSIDFRTAVRVVTSEDLAASVVTREGREVVLRLAAITPAEIALPTPEAPLEALRLERRPPITVLRLSVPPEVPFDWSYEPGLLTVLVGEQPAPELRDGFSPDLFRRLFPVGSAGPLTGDAPLARTETHAGWLVGPFTVQPYASATWTDADIQAFGSPRPVRARYLQLSPGVTVSTALRSGLLAAEYEPRFRFFSNLPVLEKTSHVFGAKLETPLGTRALVKLGHRLTLATLETTIVDPGREYFYNLSPYVFNDTTLTARVDLAARLALDAGLGLRMTRFEEDSAGFFDYDSRTARVGLGYDLAGETQMLVSYTFGYVPPSPEREIAETTDHTAGVTLTGEIGPFLSGSLSAGYQTQTSPRALGESRSFTGLVVGGSLRRTLGRSSSLELQLNRSTELSGFETSSYYLNQRAALALAVPLPFWATGNATLSFLRNDYPNDAAAIDAPRRDEILGWGLGLGRRLGQRLSFRVDYRRERRESNLPGLDVTTDGFTVQCGFSLPGSQP